MVETAPYISDWFAVGAVLVVLLLAIFIAVLVGPEPGEQDREWHEWLDAHPDAPGVLEADWRRQAAEAARDHRPLPPPVPH